MLLLIRIAISVLLETMIRIASNGRFLEVKESDLLLVDGEGVVVVA